MTPTAPEPGREPEPGVTALIGQLVDDTRELVNAEVGLYMARATERIGAYRGAAVFFAVAGVLALAALIALLVGLIMTLATVIGPGLATLAVIGVTLLVSGILAMIGKGRLVAPTLEARP